MIATRQRTDALNQVIKNLLSAGVNPNIREILKGIKDTYKGRVWGEPQTQLRPAIEWQTIGGPDGTDIETTYEEIRRDLSTFMSELIDVSDKTISNYWMFESQKEALKRRILNLIQSTEATTSGLSMGASAIFKDTFNDSQKVDLASTTAELNLDRGFVTLPMSRNSVNSLPLSGSTILSESYPNTNVHGQISDTLNDAPNTGWYATLDGGTYSCVLQLPTAVSSVEANSLYINPLAPLTIKVTASNDGYNYWFTLLNSSIQQECTMVFEPNKFTHLRIEVTGTTVGINRIKLLSVGFESSAVIDSVTHTVSDIVGDVVPIDCVKISTDASCPANTNIDYYIQAVFNSTLGPWIKVDNGLVWLSNNNQWIKQLSGDLIPRVEAGLEDSSRQFYISALNANPIIETSQLFKGGSENFSLTGADQTKNYCGQFTIDYAEYNWGEDLDYGHIPSSSDWERFGVYDTGYIRPVTVDMDSTYRIADPLKQDSENLLYNKNTCFTEVENTPSSTATNRDWLVIGIKGNNTETPSATLLKSKGNYRFTTYIYMPEDRVIVNKPCFLHNNSNDCGANNIVIAPFTILLNGNIVTQNSKSYGGELLEDLSAYYSTFSFTKGWNKLEILVYYTGIHNGIPTSESVDLSSEVATSGIGIYIGFNPYSLAKEDQSIKVQAHRLGDTMVSEFVLRQLMRPGDTSCWAWTDTAPNRNILTNNDQTILGTLLDGFIETKPPVMIVSYATPGTERPTGLRFRAVLSRQDDATEIPTLNSYSLIINPNGE